MEKIPKYRQLQEALSRRLHAEYNPGDKFLTQREIIQEYGVCLDSVERALRAMMEDGLLIRRHGSGTYVREFANPGGRGGRVALIMQRKVAWGVRDFYRDLLFEINDRLTQLDLSYNYWYLDDSNPAGMLVKRLTQENGFDGALFIGVGGEELFEQLLARGFPLVGVDRRIELPGAVYVVGDNEDGARQAVKYLIEYGHRRIGLVTPPLHTTFIDRYEGFNEALFDHGIKPERRWQLRHFRPECAVEELRPIFADGDGPSALFVINDSVAHVTVKALRELGLRVPEEVSVISFDDDFYATHTEPALTTIAAPRREMGERAVALLGELMHGQTPAPEILPVTLIERDSVCRIPPGKNIIQRLAGTGRTDL